MTTQYRSVTQTFAGYALGYAVAHVRKARIAETDIMHEQTSPNAHIGAIAPASPTPPQVEH